MRRRWCLAALVALLSSGIAGSSSQAETGPSTAALSQLIVTPSQGHPGDWVFLSGGGLDPNRHLYVVMACPNFFDPAVAQYGNQQQVPDGPTTNSRGEFAAFPFRLPPLHYYKRVGCQFYVPVGANPVGPDLVGVFLFTAPDVKLPACDRRMCVHLRSHPDRIRAGYVENIRVQGWPGARADVTISYPGKAQEAKYKQLDWQGYGSLPFRVPAGLTQPGQARIRARVRLHVAGVPDRVGDQTGQFTVIH